MQKEAHALYVEGVAVLKNLKFTGVVTVRYRCMNPIAVVAVK